MELMARVREQGFGEGRAASRQVNRLALERTFTYEFPNQGQGKGSEDK